MMEVASVLGKTPYTLESRVNGRSRSSNELGVYIALDTKQGNRVAVKLETSLHRRRRLTHEIKSYKRLQKRRHGHDRPSTDVGISTVYMSGIVGDMVYGVIDWFPLSGTSYCHASRPRAFRAAIDIINTLDHMHSRGYLFLNWAPHHIRIKDGRAYLIDFSSVARYKNQGRHAPIAEGLPTDSLGPYSSVWAHRGISSSRRDELDSLGYCVLKLLASPAATSFERAEGLQLLYIKEDLRTLCRDMPAVMTQYFQYVRALAYDAAPDYALLASMFARACDDPSQNKISLSPPRTHRGLGVLPFYIVSSGDESSPMHTCSNMLCDDQTVFCSDTLPAEITMRYADTGGACILSHVVVRSPGPAFRSALGRGLVFAFDSEDASAFPGPGGLPPATVLALRYGGDAPAELASPLEATDDDLPRPAAVFDVPRDAAEVEVAIDPPVRCKLVHVVFLSSFDPSARSVAVEFLGLVGRPAHAFAAPSSPPAEEAPVAAALGLLHPPYVRLFSAARFGLVADALEILSAKPLPFDVNATYNDRTALRVAAECGHVDIVLALIRAGAKPDEADNTGTTALYAASRAGHEAVAAALLQAGVHVDLARRGTTPLWAACAGGHAGVVRRLLAKGASPETRDRTGTPPLWLAAKLGSLEMAEMLIAAGADVNRYRSDGVTCLHAAAVHGQDEMVGLLLAHGAQTGRADQNGATPLWVASHAGHLSIVKRLVAAGAALATVRTDGASPLWIAACQGNKEIVQTLMEAGAIVDWKDKNDATPLWMAAKNGHTDMARFLVSIGARVDACRNDGVTCLHIAASNGHAETVQFLIKAGAKVMQTDKNNATALWIAAKEGHVDAMRVLIQAGSKLETARNDGATAVWIAAAKGSLDAVRLLLAARASADKKDKNGATPLWMACKNGHLPVVRELVLAAGVNIEAQRNDRVTCLAIATAGSHVEVVRFLISMGVNINYADKNNATPLWIAARHNLVEVMRVLLAAGAETEIARSDGATPLWIAAQAGQTRAANCLLEHGASLEARANDTTPLELAVAEGHTEVMQALLAATRDIQRVSAAWAPETQPLVVVAAARQKDLYITHSVEALKHLTAEFFATVQAIGQHGLRCGKRSVVRPSSVPLPAFAAPTPGASGAPARAGPGERASRFFRSLSMAKSPPGGSSVPSVKTWSADAAASPAVDAELESFVSLVLALPEEVQIRVLLDVALGLACSARPLDSWLPAGLPSRHRRLLRRAGRPKRLSGALVKAAADAQIATSVTSALIGRYEGAMRFLIAPEKAERINARAAAEITERVVAQCLGPAPTGSDLLSPVAAGRYPMRSALSAYVAAALPTAAPIPSPYDTVPNVLMGDRGTFSDVAASSPPGCEYSGLSPSQREELLLDGMGSPLGSSPVVRVLGPLNILPPPPPELPTAAPDLPSPSHMVGAGFSPLPRDVPALSLASLPTQQPDEPPSPTPMPPAPGLPSSPKNAGANSRRSGSPVVGPQSPKSPRPHPALLASAREEIMRSRSVSPLLKGDGRGRGLAADAAMRNPSDEEKRSSSHSGRGSSVTSGSSGGASGKFPPTSGGSGLGVREVMSPTTRFTSLDTSDQDTPTQRRADAAVSSDIRGSSPMPFARLPSIDPPGDESEGTPKSGMDGLPALIIRPVTASPDAPEESEFSPRAADVDVLDVSGDLSGVSSRRESDGQIEGALEGVRLTNSSSVSSTYGGGSGGVASPSRRVATSQPHATQSPPAMARAPSGDLYQFADDACDSSDPDLSRSVSESLLDWHTQSSPSAARALFRNSSDHSRALPVSPEPSSAAQELPSDAVAIPAKPRSGDVASSPASSSVPSRAQQLTERTSPMPDPRFASVGVSTSLGPTWTSRLLSPQSPSSVSSRSGSPDPPRASTPTPTPAPAPALPSRRHTDTDFATRPSATSPPTTATTAAAAGTGSVAGSFASTGSPLSPLSSLSGVETASLATMSPSNPSTSSRSSLTSLRDRRFECPVARRDLATNVRDSVGEALARNSLVATADVIDTLALRLAERLQAHLVGTDASVATDAARSTARSPLATSQRSSSVPVSPTMRRAQPQPPGPARAGSLAVVIVGARVMMPQALRADPNLFCRVMQGTTELLKTPHKKGVFTPAWGVSGRLPMDAPLRFLVVDHHAFTRNVVVGEATLDPRALPRRAHTMHVAVMGVAGPASSTSPRGQAATGALGEVVRLELLLDPDAEALVYRPLLSLPALAAFDAVVDDAVRVTALGRERGRDAGEGPESKASQPSASDSDSEEGPLPKPEPGAPVGVPGRVRFLAAYVFTRGVIESPQPASWRDASAAPAMPPRKALIPWTLLR